MQTMLAHPESPKTFTDGPAPFDDPSADIIIRSSEGVDFRTYKLLLSLASPFFKGMFDVPRLANPEGKKEDRFKSDETRDGVPVIFLYDEKNQVCGKDVVEFVLGSCHPVRLQSSKPVISAEIIGTVVDVAMRYDVESAVKLALHDPHLLGNNPFLVFAISCRRGLAAEATLAAHRTLRFRVADFPQQGTLKPASSLQYNALLEFHKRCGMAAKSAAMPGGWISAEVRGLFPWDDKCSSNNSWTYRLFSNEMLWQRWGFNQNHRFCPQWWADYMENTATNLETRPHGSTVEDQSVFDGALENACDACIRKTFHPLMRKLVPELKDRVEEAIQRVSVCSML